VLDTVELEVDCGTGAELLDDSRLLTPLMPARMYDPRPFAVLLMLVVEDVSDVLEVGVLSIDAAELVLVVSGVVT